jgi:hypothetical protein
MLLQHCCVRVYLYAQVSHVSTECDYPLGEKQEDVIPDEWAVSQVYTIYHTNYYTMLCYTVMYCVHACIHCALLHCYVFTLCYAILQ